MIIFLRNFFVIDNSVLFIFNVYLDKKGGGGRTRRLKCSTHKFSSCSQRSTILLIPVYLYISPSLMVIMWSGDFFLGQRM